MCEIDYPGAPNTWHIPTDSCSVPFPTQHNSTSGGHLYITLPILSYDNNRADILFRADIVSAFVGGYSPLQLSPRLTMDYSVNVWYMMYGGS